MDKLEVGSWYRQKDEDHGYLYIFKGRDEKRRKGSVSPYYRFDCYVDGKIDRLDMPVSDRFIHLYKNPLETLTSKEALILLGKGFVLADKFGDIYTIKNDHFYKWCQDAISPRWFPISIGILVGFTIHALPEEAGE